MIQLILVDTRMHSSSSGWAGVSSGVGEYKATHDPHQAVLSREQWRWLEAELNKPADLRIVVGNQILPARRDGSLGSVPDGARQDDGSAASPRQPHRRERRSALGQHVQR